MTCPEFWSLFGESAGDDFATDSGAQAHLRGCPACAAHLARQGELTAGLRRLAGTFGSVNAPSRVEARLRAAFRAQYGVPARAEATRWRSPLAWAMACSVVVLAGLSISLTRQPEPPLGRPAAAEFSSETSEAYTVDAGLLADGFIPLPNGEGVDANESFNLVRVEVPRSAMMTVGIPVSADQAWEPVEADVVLGSDGLARAVRFLN